MDKELKAQLLEAVKSISTGTKTQRIKTVHGGNNGWKSLIGLATTTSTGLVLMAEASASSAAAVGSDYDQGEVQAILDELRDLKTKMRAAGLLSE